MKYCNLVDMHTHSEHSFDADDKVEELVLSAIDKGVKILSITDHCDIDGEDLDINTLCTNQLGDIQRCIDCYGDKIKILKGLEIGQGVYRKEKTDYLLSNYSYDFILGSIHNLDGMEDFYFLDYSRYDVNALLERYFNDLYELCEWGRFDSLAHLTYPLRYITGREGIEVDLTRFGSLIDGVFRSLIKNGKALEINSSGLFQELGDTMPSIGLVKRYRELGGELITVGSDSHSAGRIAQGIEQALDIAKSCGFKKVTVFEKHQPMFIDIE